MVQPSAIRRWLTGAEYAVGDRPRHPPYPPAAYPPWRGADGAAEDGHVTSDRLPRVVGEVVVRPDVLASRLHGHTAATQQPTSHLRPRGILSMAVGYRRYGHLSVARLSACAHVCHHVGHIISTIYTPCCIIGKGACCIIGKGVPVLRCTAVVCMYGRMP